MFQDLWRICLVWMIAYFLESVVLFCLFVCFPVFVVESQTPLLEL